MILSPHILTGAAIASRIQNPILGIFLAFLSHYLLDIPPHKEYSIDNIKGRRWAMVSGDLLKVFLDMLSALAIIYFLTENNPMVYWGGLAAIMPDGLTLLHLVFPKNQLLAKHFNFHVQFNEIAKKINIAPFGEILTQLTAAALAIYFLI